MDVASDLQQPHEKCIVLFPIYISRARLIILSDAVLKVRFCACAGPVVSEAYGTQAQLYRGSLTGP